MLKAITAAVDALSLAGSASPVPGNSPIHGDVAACYKMDAAATRWIRVTPPDFAVATAFIVTHR